MRRFAIVMSALYLTVAKLETSLMSSRKLRKKCPCCGEFLYDTDAGIFCLGCGYEDMYYYISLENRRKPKQEKTPNGCKACGGPYPMCKDSCNIFDT